MYDGGHEQKGLWLLTWHFANSPHVPGHGSWQCWLIQARIGGHSEFDTHSGRHIGGEPTNDGKQVQIAWPLYSRHLLFGPHGEGTHGFVCTGSTEKSRKRTAY